MMCAEEMMSRAEDWVKANPRAWQRMKDIAHQNVVEGHLFSIDQLCTIARYEMRVNGLSQGFKVNNTLRAPLARMLMEQVPGASKWMETRRSKVDGVVK